MISLKDINIAINTILKNSFPTIEIESRDIEEGIKRPSFKVMFDDLNSGAYMSTHKGRNLTVRIYYFPSNRDKYKLEIMDIIEKLESVFFQKLKIKDDFYLNIDELEMVITSGILNANMDLNIIEELENIDKNEYIETLSINTKNN